MRSLRFQSHKVICLAALASVLLLSPRHWISAPWSGRNTAVAAPVRGGGGADCDEIRVQAESASWDKYRIDLGTQGYGMAPPEKSALRFTLFNDHRKRMDAIERQWRLCKYGDADYGGPEL